MPEDQYKIKAKSEFEMMKIYALAQSKRET